jgi:hypothetical protein
MRLEVLWQRHGIGHGRTKVRRQVVNAERLRAKAGQQRISRRRTHGLVAVSPFETRTTGSKTIDVGRLHHLIAITAQDRLEIVNANQQDIRPLGGHCLYAKTSQPQDARTYDLH